MGKLISAKDDKQLTQDFLQILKRVTSLFKTRLPVRPKDQVSSVQWGDLPLIFDSPRFGVIEIPGRDNRAAGSNIRVAKELQHSPPYILKWLLWREAILALLVPQLRSIPEVADLGLYGGLKYGIQNPKHRKALQKLWVTLSPIQYYECYRYFPTSGFGIFDDVVDGVFLEKVIPWLNSLRRSEQVPLSSKTFTATLERWMQETHRVLNDVEFRIITTLSATPINSQRQLADKINISQTSLSQSLRRLARTHLLRFFLHMDVPLIGLDFIGAILEFSKNPVHKQVKQLLRKHPYFMTSRSITNSLLVAHFLIPVPNKEDFHIWINRMCDHYNLNPPLIHIVTDGILSRNFQNYRSGIGWFDDFSSMLDIIHSSICEEVPNLAPPLRNYRYSYGLQTDIKSQLLPLHPEDFTYFKRKTDIFSLSETVITSPAREARLRGLSESEYRRYLRRASLFDRLGVSSPIGISLFHIGLDAIIHIMLFSGREVSEQVIRAFQLLPHTVGVIFNDGSAEMHMLVPNAAAVEIYSSIRNSIAKAGIEAKIALEPAWQYYLLPPTLISPDKYDFNTGEWLWQSDSIPKPNGI